MKSADQLSFAACGATRCFGSRSGRQPAPLPEATLGMVLDVSIKGLDDRRIASQWIGRWTIPSAGRRRDREEEPAAEAAARGESPGTPSVG